MLATAIASASAADVDAMMFAAVTDHVFVDEGHTLDFTNKAFEALALVDSSGGLTSGVLTALVRQTCAADRSEESSEWRHPRDLAALAAEAEDRLEVALEKGWAVTNAQVDVGALAWSLLDDDPDAVVGAVLDAVGGGAAPEQVGRALALAAALRIVRFHTQNDFGDWNSVHHAFTAANALHQSLVRCPSPELLRGAIHGALRVYLDRFLNVPAARAVRRSTARRHWRTWRRAGTCRARWTGPGRSPTGSCAAAGRGRRADRRARPRPAGRGRRVPLVPGVRGRRAPGAGRGRRGRRSRR